MVSRQPFANEAGFTLTEMLVTMFLLSLAVSTFMGVMFSVSRGAERSRDVVRVSEEARLGFNRMVRDTREGREIIAADSTSYRVQIDFNADGVITPAPNPNPAGDYEDLTFEWNETALSVRINGEVLMREVDCLRNASNLCESEVFTYTSDRFEYDWNADGVVTWEELDDAPLHGVVGVGNANGVLDGSEFPFLSNVTYSFQLRDDSADSKFYTEAQLRNLR